MFQWKITAKVADCQGFNLHPSAQYFLLLGLNDRFSNPSNKVSPSSHSSSSIPFNCLLTLNFNSQSCELPSSQMQLILVSCQKQDARRGEHGKEEIVGIATITVFYPLQDYLKEMRIFRFEKSLDPKATLKAEITLQLTKKQHQLQPQTTNNRNQTTNNRKSLRLSPKYRNSPQHGSQRSLSKKKSLSVSEKSIDSGGASKSQLQNVSKYKETIKALTQQRNQLFKVSQDLYKQLNQSIKQLNQSIKERDQYLKQLEERELSQEQIKAELQFLKLKIYQYQQSHSQQQQHTLQRQLWQQKVINEQLQTTVEQHEKTIAQLQRKVRESLIALHDFKEEALTARSELIHKESQLSFISRQSKSLDTMECMQELLFELQQRNFQQPLQFTCIYQQEHKLTEMVSLIKKDIVSLLVRVLGRMKLQKDKQWVLKQKVEIQRALQERILQFSIYDHH